MADDVVTVPAGLPVPVDDGAADHLRGVIVPPLALAATSGEYEREFVERGRIEHVWYPVFPPHRNADTVLAWLRGR